MNEYLILACAAISIFAAFIKQGVFNRLFSLLMASTFIILMIYHDTSKIFVAIIISLVVNFMLLMTNKEYKKR